MSVWAALQAMCEEAEGQAGADHGLREGLRQLKNLSRRQSEGEEGWEDLGQAAAGPLVLACRLLCDLVLRLLPLCRGEAPPRKRKKQRKRRR